VPDTNQKPAAKFTGYRYGGRSLGLTYVKYTNVNGGMLSQMSQASPHGSMMAKPGVQQQLEVRRLTAEAQEAEARARQAEYALAHEKQLAKRERAIRERRRRAELEDRAELEALLNRRRPVHVVQ
jgi:hypothetical protein